MEYQHPRWQRLTFFCFSLFVLIFPLSLIILGVIPEHEDDQENYLLGGFLSLIIVAVPIEVFARYIFSSVAITRKALIIRPGGIFLRFFMMSKRYPFSDFLFYILLENGEPVMVDIYDLNKEIQAHIYNPRVRQFLLRIAQHEYLPNFHVGQVESPLSIS